ncbi:hypothetical protein EDD18DRAFT_120909 [Armillaria luteobubalina]|uniref:Protein kinase domain-containing protein n=1 Tax=Armillaria luteobubalina TaxID=153913 RepID=A0AA39Q7W3_9AGAR|nr:hypothetical protein EDD18DRAFT_120909 [Armillaria luteobubalina]
MEESKRPRSSEPDEFYSPIIDPVLDQFWVDSRLFLEEAGYRLPQKFDPSWSPADRMEELDARARFPRRVLMSAVKLSDGSQVLLKKLDLNSTEFELSVLFSSPPLSLDPKNHCIPVFQVLKYEQFGILVLPLLRKFDDPPFDTVGEVVECFRQIFEGIQFMHQNFVAHRDCTKLNIMMDPTKLYPKGFLPEEPYRTIDRKGFVSPSCTRTACWPRYFLIDFGHSRRYDPADGIPHESVLRGGDKSAPEHRNFDALPCNPFPTDIYYLGNLLREYFLDTKKYCNPTRIGLDFLRPLVEDMVKENPCDRPTIDDVVMRFDTIVNSLSWCRLRALPQLGNQPLFFPFTYAARRLKFTLMLKSALPKTTASPSRVLPASRDFYTSKRQ